MNIRIYAVYDSKAERYLQPFFTGSKGEAIRSITNVVNDPSHNFCTYAEDFTLFEIGEYNDQKGEISSTPPLSLGNLIEFKDSERFPVKVDAGTQQVTAVQ